MQTKKRKKKASVQAPSEAVVNPAASSPQAASQSKLVSKKAKTKDKKKEETNDLDKALAELSIKCVVSVSVSLGHLM